MSRAYSPSNILQKKFKLMDFDGEFERLIGKPELSGHWFIHGNSANGKTNFTIQLAKYLCRFEKVAYNALEEGVSETTKIVLERNRMHEQDGLFTILDKEPIGEFIERLNKRKAPKIGIIDSFQASQLTERKFLAIKVPKNTLLIWISHAKGKEPRGEAAVSARYYANVKIFIEGYKAFAESRYLDNTSEPFTIYKAGADKYHANINE